MITKKKLIVRNRILFSLVGLLGIATIVGTTMAYSGSASNVVEHADNVNVGVQAPMAGMIGGTLTSEPTHLTYSDDYQSVNSLYEYGDLEVDGTTYLDGAVEMSSTLSASGEVTLGDTETGDLVENGGMTTITTSSATYTLTAAQVCNNSTLFFIPLGGVLTVTLPSTSTLFADCLPAAGAVKNLILGSQATSTIVAVPGSNALGFTNTSTIVSSGSPEFANLTLNRGLDSTLTYGAYLTNYNGS